MFKRGSANDRGPAVLINAGNLVEGGGVQVAVSFLEELSTMKKQQGCLLPSFPNANVSISASPQVVRNLSDRATSVLDELCVHDSRTRFLPKRDLREFDVAFHIFGPVYFPPSAARTVMGFADGTSLNAAEVIGEHNAASRMKLRIRQVISRRIFAKADCVIAETSSVAHLLVTKWGVRRAEVKVVPNTLNGVFRESLSRRRVIGKAKPSVSPVVVGYPARPYPHKNFNRLGAAAAVLNSEYGLNVTLVVPLTDKEVMQVAPLFREYFTCIGPVKTADLPGFYQSCDIIAFPSLLESFSATPLEALAMEVPLVASDRDFVRVIAGDAALYFDPLNPHSIAWAVSHCLSDKRHTAERVGIGRDIALRWPSARHRAENYVRIIEEEIVKGSRFDHR